MNMCSHPDSQLSPVTGKLAEKLADKSGVPYVCMHCSAILHVTTINGSFTKIEKKCEHSTCISNAIIKKNEKYGMPGKYVCKKHR